MDQQRAAIWNRDFSLLWLTNFLMATSFYLLLPTVPAFATDVLAASKGQVGYLVGSYSVASLGIRPLAGYLLDARGRKVIYLGGLAVFALFSASYPVATTLLVLLLIRFVHGLSWGVLTTGGTTVAADLLPPERRGEGLGYFGLTMTLAMAFGPLLGQEITAGGAYGRLFLAAGTISAIAVLAGLLVRYPAVASAVSVTASAAASPLPSPRASAGASPTAFPAGSPGAPLTGSRRSLRWDAFIDLRTLPVGAVALVTMMSYSAIITFLPLFTQERGLNAGLFFLVYAAVMSLSRPLAGRLLDQRGPALVLVSGLLLLMVGFLFLGLGQGLAHFLLAAVLLGVGNGNLFPTLQAMALALVEPERRGVASSTLFSANDLGIGLGATLLGWVADATNLRAMYLFAGAVLVAPLAWFWLYLRHYYEERAPRGETQAVPRVGRP